LEKIYAKQIIEQARSRKPVLFAAKQASQHFSASQAVGNLKEVSEKMINVTT